MRENRPALFRGRHFRSDVIVLCVRWYLRYPLSYRDLEEMMAERGLAIDHSTIARWVLYYAPILNQRIRREMRHPNRSWRVDETYLRVAGKMDLFISGYRFGRKHNRFPLVAVSGFDCGQRLSPTRFERRAGPAASHQCRRPPGICNRDPGTEAIG